MTYGAIAAAVIGAGAGLASSNMKKGQTTVQSPSASTSSTDIGVLDDATLKVLKDLALGGQYSKQAAATDSQLAVEGAIKQAMQQYMPSIVANQKGSGMVGDSMTQLLSQQAASNAGIAGAQVQRDWTGMYGSQQANLLQSLIQGTGQSVRSRETNSGTTQTQTSGGMSWICTVAGMPEDVLARMELFKTSGAPTRRQVRQYLVYAPMCLNALMQNAPEKYREFIALVRYKIIPKIDAALTANLLSEALILYKAMCALLITITYEALEANGNISSN